MIHWCGTGLSSVPGLRRLIEGGREVTVWNRTTDKARQAIGDLTDRIEAFDADALAARLQPGDVVVSMLPADWHPRLATAAIEAGAHFVSSSYVAPEMRALDDAARGAGVAIVGEVGLDPGIDHLMAHDLVARYRPHARPGDSVSFRSYCGGFPAVPNPFRYKFSWSPLGVLKALRSPSRSIRDGEEREVARPWSALGRFDAPLPEPETFEVFANRDSLPYVAAYGFDPAWDVQEFVRGTLRLDGWAEAWRDVFTTVETGDEASLSALADTLWETQRYGPDEADRVVLIVDLAAVRDGGRAWQQTWVLDATGDARGSAMARLVSVPVAMAVEAAPSMPPGVQAVPSQPEAVRRWLDEIAPLAQHMERVERGA